MNTGQAAQHILLIKVAGRRYRAFSIIMHYPKSIEMQQELAKKVAAVHAQTVIEKIKSMPCPIEQKEALIDAIKEVHQNEDGA